LGDVVAAWKIEFLPGCFRSFPELRSCPLGDLLDMLGSVSPYMSYRNSQYQQRYRALVKAEA
jgi:hypothetical protein